MCIKDEIKIDLEKEKLEVKVIRSLPMLIEYGM
jgi:hypothetical protein